MAREGAGLMSIAQVAADHAISRNHAMKVVNVLANAGLLETVRGRSGGFRLGGRLRPLRLAKSCASPSPASPPRTVTAAS
nr:Rrf2 family transcriptional regulator [Novosphingobium sp. ST904]